MEVCFQGISPETDDCCQKFYHNNVVPSSTHSDEDIELDNEDESNSNPQNCCYDADASNDSSDLNLSSSHNDSDHNHHHLVGENDKLPPPPSESKIGDKLPLLTTKQKKKLPFVPFSEETVFLDPTIEEAPLPSISTSSPLSGDSWMNYSNSNSSDDFSGISEHIKAVTSGRCTGNNSSDEGSTDFNNTISQNSVLMKRLRSRDEYDDDDRGELMFTPEESSSQQKGSVKRSRTHNKYHNDDTLLADDEDDDGKHNKEHFRFASSTPNVIPVTSPVETPRTHNFSNNKCSSKLSHLSKSLDYTSTQDSAICRDSGSTPNSISLKNASVDIRLIDFAHTTFVPRRASITSNITQTTPVLHHGPDGGFLTGLDSLNRLLNEILAEEN